MMNAKDWPKTMERIHEYQWSYLGKQNIPLACIARKDDVIPTIDSDGGYLTVQDEMIARARHFSLGPEDSTKVADPTYVTNCKRVWEKIAEITLDQSCWTYVKPVQRTPDGLVQRFV